MSIESVPKEASSVDGAVDTVDGVPIIPPGASESCAGGAAGATRGEDAGLSRSPIASCVPIDKTAVDCTVLSSPSLLFPSEVLCSILSSIAQDESATLLCPILAGTWIDCVDAANGSGWRGGEVPVGDVVSLLCLVERLLCNGVELGEM